MKSFLISEKNILTSEKHCFWIYRKYTPKQDAIPLLIFSKSGKVKNSKSYLVNKVYIFYCQSYKITLKSPTTLLKIPKNSS